MAVNPSLLQIRHTKPLVCFSSEILLLIFRPVSVSTTGLSAATYAPLGAIYGPFYKFALYRFTFNKENASSAARAKKPALYIPVYKNPNSADLHRGGDCRRACPTRASSQR
jgi:hypothetical protein